MFTTMIVHDCLQHVGRDAQRRDPSACDSRDFTLVSPAVAVTLSFSNFITEFDQNELSLEKNKDQLSLTNPRDVLHHGERAANNKVDVQCDKLATGLTLRVESRQFTATAPAFNLPHLHFAPPLGRPRLSFAEIFGTRKL